MSRVTKSVFLAFQEYSRLFFVQFKCISIVTESILSVSFNVQCQWRSVRIVSPCSGPTPFFQRGCLLTTFGSFCLTYAHMCSVGQ